MWIKDLQMTWYTQQWWVSAYKQGPNTATVRMMIKIFAVRMEVAKTLSYPFKPVAKIRIRLFKTNYVVSLRVVKLSNLNFSNMPIYFVGKMWEAFALQKLLLFIQQKISVYLVIKS